MFHLCEIEHCVSVWQCQSWGIDKLYPPKLFLYVNALYLHICGQGVLNWYISKIWLSWIWTFNSKKQQLVHCVDRKPLCQDPVTLFSVGNADFCSPRIFCLIYLPSLSVELIILYPSMRLWAVFHKTVCGWGYMCWHHLLYAHVEAPRSLKFNVCRSKYNGSKHPAGKR